MVSEGFDEYAVVTVVLNGQALFAGQVENDSAETIGRAARRTMGHCAPDLRLDATGEGIVIGRPVEAVMSWSRVGEIVAAGLAEDLLERWRGAYRRYCELVGANGGVRQDPGGIDRFYAEYRATTEAMRAAQQEIIRRGLDALRPSQGALF